MEKRLGSKIDSLGANVNKNKESISLLTNTVNKNTVDLAHLESQLRSNENDFEKKVTVIVRSAISGEASVESRPATSPLSRSTAMAVPHIVAGEGT